MNHPFTDRLHHSSWSWLLGLVLISFFATVCPCRFPEEWQGRWFQKGISDAIRISHSDISEKGICRETSGDKFLIENRSERCVRCIVINQKHANVLQYKETFCFPSQRSNPRRLRDVCSEINGDAQLYSLFRLDTPPVPCPFSGPFTFSYSRGQGECKEPLSTIESCVQPSQLLFRFQACADVMGSESRLEELSCFGEWKEGSVRYLVGKMSHRITRTDEDKFRCFVFEKISRTSGSSIDEGYLMAQSGDATCDGLSSVYEGSRTMKLIQSSAMLPSCEFPPDVTLPKYWKTIDEIYDFSKNSTLRVYNHSTAEILKTITCIREEASSSISADGQDDNPSDDDGETSSYTDYVVHSVSGCDIGFTCLRVHRRQNQIVEVEVGNSLTRDDFFSGESGCSYQRFSKNYLTLSLAGGSGHSPSIPRVDDLNNMRDGDNPPSSFQDPGHSNPSSSSSQIVALSCINSLTLIIMTVISQRMKMGNSW